MYDSPRDTTAQLEKFLQVLGLHQQQLVAQMQDLQANLDEIKVHQRETKALLAKSLAKGADEKAKTIPTPLSGVALATPTDHT